MKINIRGFNTYLRHKDFKCQDPDLPGYSIYYVYCECSTDYRQTLQEDLSEKLIPKCDSNLAMKFAVKDTNYGEYYCIPDVYCVYIILLYRPWHSGPWNRHPTIILFFSIIAFAFQKVIKVFDKKLNKQESEQNLPVKV